MNRLLYFTRDACPACFHMNTIMTMLKYEGHLIDTIKCTEKDDKNRELSEKYAVEFFPMVIKVDEEGNVISKVSGYRERTELLEKLGEINE